MRQELVLGVAEGEYEFVAIRGALIKLFPDTIVNQGKRSVPDRKPGHVTDHKANDRFRQDESGKQWNHQVSCATLSQHFEPENVKHPEKIQCYFSGQIVLPTLSACLCQSAALVFLAPRKLA